MKGFPDCEHGQPVLSSLTCAQKGHLGCDNAPSSATGHAGRCGSLDEHLNLFAQGVGVGPGGTAGGGDMIASDHELIASEFHGRYPQ